MFELGIGSWVAWGVLLFGVSLLAKGIKIINQSECMVVERLGKYHRTLSSGFNVVIPVVDLPRMVFWITNNRVVPVLRIDMRETVLDVAEQSVITRDNVQINIDAILYIQVTDPVKATYEISNLPVAVGQLAQTALRNVIGGMDLDHTLSSRDVINAKLKAILDEATDKWGTKVNRVELKNIMPPREIQVAMEKQMQAERERRAKVLEAEGDKQARIFRSEGQKQEQINLADGDRESTIRRAVGQADAILKVAEANASAIEQIKKSIGQSELAVQYLIANNYLEKFGEFTQKPGDKVFIPYESSASLGALGSIKELLAKQRVSL